MFNLNWDGINNALTGAEIRFFCLTGCFWCWCKSHWSSHIATKDFHYAVSPLFCLAFAVNFPNFSYKEFIDLQKINLFTLILFNIFLRKYYHAFTSCSKHPWNPKQIKVDICSKPTFSLINKAVILHQQIALVFNINCNLLKLSLRLLQICSYSFFSFIDFYNYILIKLLL